ncbi:hypothetical protein AX774_g2151 [Zancudomyces culisetae]|uniref:Uncharacterized protein n=1 Tax=Zancudomyces culisetae TaxID=1213189 RepID=A0A1R1PTN4_ZANCU|nr:hypothetical protein AX774_g2151 [Zancudomyces culisetae]|eukprot:OMH84330.1 hypothetical protein AX774_g2151 [Zancudomyces culisetae]
MSREFDLGDGQTHSLLFKFHNREPYKSFCHCRHALVNPFNVTRSHEATYTEKETKLLSKPMNIQRSIRSPVP